MKKTAIYITIGALILTLATSQPVIASEISGTISTDGGAEQNGTPSPTPTPTPTPGGNDSGHSSEVSGDLGTGGNNNGGNNGGLSGTVTGGNDPLGYVYVGTTIYYGSNNNPNNQDTASTTASSTPPGISDEEAAHLAMLEFGPRYGVGGSYTPGPPYAGGNYGNLSVGSGGGMGESTDVSSLDGSSYGSPFAYVPRAGEGPVLPSEGSALAASALVDAAGLSFAQLVLIALIGLILLASMGYAISRANRDQRTV